MFNVIKWKALIHSDLVGQSGRGICITCCDNLPFTDNVNAVDMCDPSAQNQLHLRKLDNKII